MTFYRPQIAYFQSWAFAAAAGSARARSVSLPPIATTQGVIFTAWTSQVASGSDAISGGNGSYYSSTGTQLSQALGASSAMATYTAVGTHRYAACNLIGDAETVAVNTPLNSYLAAGIRYDFTLGTAAAVGDPTLSIPVNALLTIMVLDGVGSGIPATVKGRTGASFNYGPVISNNTFGTNYWLDAGYGVQIHQASCFGGAGAYIPGVNNEANWLHVAQVSVSDIYHDVAVGANSPISSTLLNSFMWHEVTPSSGEWVTMQYYSDIVPAEVLVAVPSQLVTILG